MTYVLQDDRIIQDLQDEQAIIAKSKMNRRGLFKRVNRNADGKALKTTRINLYSLSRKSCYFYCILVVR